MQNVVKRKTKPMKKVAIVGSASSSLDMTPWQDRSFDIWALAWRRVERCTRFFDMHPVPRKSKNIPPKYLDYLANLNVPVYMQKTHVEVPNSVEYPLVDVIEFFGNTLGKHVNGSYFASSIAYLFCLAVYEGYKEIYLYGIDLIDEGEYAYQRPNMAYLVGVARGLGRTVFIPETSALLRFSHAYGYEPFPDEGLINPKILKDRLAQYQEKREKALALLYTADGAIQEVQQLLALLKFTGRGRPLMVRDEEKKTKQDDKARIVDEARIPDGGNHDKS